VRIISPGAAREFRQRAGDLLRRLRRAGDGGHLRELRRRLGDPGCIVSSSAKRLGMPVSAIANGVDAPGLAPPRR
jgi:hypothetical protein